MLDKIRFSQQELFKIILIAVASAALPAVIEMMLTGAINTWRGWVPVVAGIVGGVLAGILFIALSSPSVNSLNISPRTAQDLIALRKDMTSIEAEGVVAPHIGQWVRVSGTIRDIERKKDFGLFFNTEKISVMIEESSNATAFLEFRTKSSRQILTSMHKGDWLEAIGKVSTIDWELYTILAKRLDLCVNIG